jgi:hypothetical protein
MVLIGDLEIERVKGWGGRRHCPLCQGKEITIHILLKYSEIALEKTAGCIKITELRKLGKLLNQVNM